MKLAYSLGLSIRTIMFLAALSLSLYFLFSLAQRTVQIYQLKREEVQLQRKIQTLQLKHQQLWQERDGLERDTDIEKIAREELNLIKPGETAVIVLASEEAKQRARQAIAEPGQEGAPARTAWWAWFFPR